MLPTTFSQGFAFCQSGVAYILLVFLPLAEVFLCREVDVSALEDIRLAVLVPLLKVSFCFKSPLLFDLVLLAVLLSQQPQTLLLGLFLGQNGSLLLRVLAHSLKVTISAPNAPASGIVAPCIAGNASPANGSCAPWRSAMAGGSAPNTSESERMGSSAGGWTMSIFSNIPGSSLCPAAAASSRPSCCTISSGFIMFGWTGIMASAGSKAAKSAGGGSSGCPCAISSRKSMLSSIFILKMQEHKQAPPPHEPLLDHGSPNLRRQSSVFRQAPPTPPEQIQSHYDKKRLEYLGQFVLSLVLLLLFTFISKPKGASTQIQIWAYIFLGSYMLRLVFMFLYLRAIWTRGMVSPCTQCLYFLYHITAWGLFLTFVIILFTNHSFTSSPGVYEIVLIIVVAVGFILYYELTLIILVLSILVPIFCCMACCCPNRNSSSWTPTPQSVIQRLTHSNFQQSQHQAMKECIICQEDYKEGDQLITLDCDSRHYFHEQCIEEWLKRNNLCPICRMPVSVLGRSQSRVVV